MLNRTLAVAERVLGQLRRDRRFLGFSLVAPVFIVYLLKVFFDSAETPVFNPTAFVTPVGAFIVHFVTYVLCTMALVRERTAHTLARMFVNGYRPIEIIGGYMLAYTGLATLQSLIVLAELNLLFDLDHALATLLSIYLVIWMLAIISLALGILISNFARNEGQAVPFIPLVIMPSVFVSGLIVPVDKMPTWAQVLSRITPLYYANEIIHELSKVGGTLGDAWKNLIFLPIYGVSIMLLATLTLRESD